MISEVLRQSEVKYNDMIEHYDKEADILGLKGHMKVIHVAQTMNHLKEIPEFYKIAYCNIMGEIFQNDEMLFNLKAKNGEILRLHNYVDGVLFDGRNEDLEHPFMFYTCPSVEEIKRNGIQYYYYKAGEPTYEDLARDYSKFEILFMTAFLHLFVKQDFVVTENCSKDGLAMTLLSLVEDVMDPRMILTLFGPRVIHNNVDCNLNNPRNLVESAHNTGLVTANKNQLDLFKHYCVSQVTNSIFEEIDNFRPITEQIDDPPENFTDYLYLGLGDGLSDYKPIKKTEVSSELRGKSNSIIRKAIFLLQKEMRHEKEIKELFQLLNEKKEFDIDIKQDKNTKIYLSNMFNIGMQFIDSQTELLSHNPYDIILRMNVEPTNPYWTERLKNIIFSLLIMIKEVPDSLKRAPLITIEDNQYHPIECGNEFELENFMEVLQRFLDIGLYDAIFAFGKELIITSNYYHYHFYNTPLLVSGISVDDVSDETE